jgi:hypothetical protein
MTAGTFAEHDVLLLICDVSGYTRFMVSNSESRSHGYAVVTELMQCLLREVKRPVDVAKLEGDAAFLYARLPSGRAQRDSTASDVVRMMDRMFLAFDEKRRELSQSNICTCGACKNIDGLSLKMVVHAGQAAIHPIGRFSELSGVDVILVHRLLKNSLQMDRYVLMTTEAQTTLRARPESHVRSCEEDYGELGIIRAEAAVPPLCVQAINDAAGARRYNTFGWKAFHILKRILISRLLRLRLLRPRHFGNIPATNEQ